jgi:hypothetical protein
MRLIGQFGNEFKANFAALREQLLDAGRNLAVSVRLNPVQRKVLGSFITTSLEACADLDLSLESHEVVCSST